MLWEDIQYESEKYRSDGSLLQEPNKVAPNLDLLSYKQLISIRNGFKSLRRGSVKTILIDDEKNFMDLKENMRMRRFACY